MAPICRPFSPRAPQALSPQGTRSLGSQALHLASPKAFPTLTSEEAPSPHTFKAKAAPTHLASAQALLQPLRPGISASERIRISAPSHRRSKRLCAVQAFESLGQTRQSSSRQRPLKSRHAKPQSKPPPPRGNGPKASASEGAPHGRSPRKRRMGGSAGEGLVARKRGFGDEGFRDAEGFRCVSPRGTVRRAWFRLSADISTVSYSRVSLSPRRAARRSWIRKCALSCHGKHNSQL